MNVLAPYVITGRLLDLIAKAPEGGRVVNVASLSASYSLDFDNLQVSVAIEAQSVSSISKLVFLQQGCLVFRATILREVLLQYFVTVSQGQASSSLTSLPACY